MQRSISEINGYSRQFKRPRLWGSVQPEAMRMSIKEVLKTAEDVQKKQNSAGNIRRPPVAQAFLPVRFCAKI
jgi:hypothetical protein